MIKNIFLTLIVLVMVLVGAVTFISTRAGDVTTSGTASTTATITNVAPVIDTIAFSDTAYGTDTLSSTGILPNLRANRTIYVSGTVSDQNGDTDSLE